MRSSCRSPRTPRPSRWGKAALRWCAPTGSFKDRGMVVAVAKAIEEGAHSVVCASTGNTSASAAAYAARAGLKCAVIVAASRIAIGKLAQTRAYGTAVVSTDAEFDVGLQIARELARRPGVAIVNSVNPHRLDGQKTAAFELCDALGSAPDELYVPVGNAGNITAYWKGFREYKEAGLSNNLPAMRGFQSEGASPIV